VERWWVPEPTFLSVMEGGADLIAPSFGWDLPWNGQTWGAATLVTVTLILIWIGLRGRTMGAKLVLWSFLLTLPAIELVFSIRRPIFLTRTLTWVMIPLALGLALAATQPRRLWPATTSVLIVVSLAGGIAYHSTYEKSGWDEAADLVADRAGPGTVVLVQPANTTVAFNHYFNRLGVETPTYGVPSGIPDRIGRGPTLVESDKEQITELVGGYKEVWLVANRPDESFESTLEPLATDLERHQLTDLVVVRYEIGG
jgi:hypothetical protein